MVGLFLFCWLSEEVGLAGQGRLERHWQPAFVLRNVFRTVLQKGCIVLY